MDLFIETLTGTAFEMTVSPFDTIMSIKSKIQRVEGIPISHQHLLYNLQELDDSSSLIDHSIQNGATLKLVLSMRGGPISTRRVHTGEEFTWKELREFMENGREDMYDYVPPGCRVTVLVFRDGDQVNLFRVLENEDGTYSPLSESLSGSSIQSLFTEDDPEESAKRLQENSVTMCKMQELKTRMEALALRRKPKRSAPRVVSARRPLLHSRRGGGVAVAAAGGGGLAVRAAAVLAQQPPGGVSSSPPPAPALHLPPLRKTHAHAPVAATSSSYLSTSSFLTTGAGTASRRNSRHDATSSSSARQSSLLLQLPRLQEQQQQQQRQLHPHPPPRRLHSLAHHPATPLSLAPKRPAARRRPRLATQVLDAKPSEWVEYGASSYHPHPSTSLQTARRAEEEEELEDDNDMPSSSSESGGSGGGGSKSGGGGSIVSASKIAIVEPETATAAATTRRSSIAVPLPSTTETPSAAAAAFAMSSITRERVTTSVGGGGGRYRVSRFVLEEEDRPKTSPDKLTQQQKRAQEICDLLTETKWHSRRHKVNCSSVEELSSDVTREKGTASRLHSRRESDLLASEQSIRFRNAVLDLPLVRAARMQRGYETRSHHPTNSPVPKPETESLGIFGQRGTRRRVPSGQLLPSALKNSSTLLPLIGAPTSKPAEVPGKKVVRHRCAQCRKRLNITNMYTCRCEKLFCSAHRYSELHECTFDYKSEGRKLIEQANPLVTAPKLPKI